MLSWGNPLVLFGSLNYQLYRSWTSNANAQHLKDITDAATRPLGIDLSQVLETNHLSPTTEKEMRHPYYPCNVTGKPACTLHSGAMRATFSSASIGARTPLHNDQAVRRTYGRRVRGYPRVAPRRQAWTSCPGAMPWQPARTSGTLPGSWRPSVH